jgi:hypothetical protein
MLPLILDSFGGLKRQLRAPLPLESLALADQASRPLEFQECPALANQFVALGALQAFGTSSAPGIAVSSKV